MIDNAALAISCTDHGDPQEKRSSRSSVVCFHNSNPSSPTVHAILHGKHEMESCTDSDDGFEHVSDYHFSGSEGDFDEPEEFAVETPDSSPNHSIPYLPPCREKRLRCPRENCDKSFNRQAKLNEHLRSHDNLRIFKCPYDGCTKDYLRGTHLQHHIKSAHTKEREHNCTREGCDKKFLTATRLRRHLKSHQDQDQYRCQGYDGCDATFRKKGTLQAHIASVHEMMKPFPCDEFDLQTDLPCTKAFDTADQLRQHKNKQHDPKRFRCDQCWGNEELLEEQCRNLGLAIPKEISFPTYHDLQEHNIIYHPPTCQHCSSTFMTNKELTQHLEIVHDIVNPAAAKEKVIKCPFPTCDKTYTKQGNLNTHINTNHKMLTHDCVEHVARKVMSFDERAKAVSMHGSVAATPFCGVRRSTKQSLIDHIRSHHLGLPTKQSLRKEAKKQAKASRAAKVTKKSGRGGTRKTSRIKQLAEASMPVDEGSDGEPVGTVFPADIESPTMEAQDWTIFDDQPAPTRDSFSPDIDLNMFSDSMGLTGETTMLEDHIFDQAGAYHYPSGEYPAARHDELDWFTYMSANTSPTNPSFGPTL